MATPGFGGDLRPFGRTKKKPQVFRKRRGSPALRFFLRLPRRNSPYVPTDRLAYVWIQNCQAAATL